MVPDCVKRRDVVRERTTRPSNTLSKCTKGLWKRSQRCSNILAFYKNTYLSNFWNLEPTQYTISAWGEGQAGNSFLARSVEVVIMALKASIFEDTESFEKLAADPTPTEAKKLGRSVNDFSQQKWDKLVLRVAVDVLYWKFTNNEEIKSKLIATGDRMLAEASIFDKSWGIGLDASHTDVDSPSRWKGCNVLGYALMIVRNLVRTGLPAPWNILEKDKSGGNSTPSQTRGCGVSLHLPHFNSSSQRPPAFSFVNDTGLRDTSGITTATPQTLGKRARGVWNPQAHSNPQLDSCPDDKGTRSTTNQLMLGELAHDAQHCENTTWGNPAGGSVIPTQHTSNSASDSRAHRQPLRDAVLI